MKKYLPFLIGGAVLLFFLKKKGATAGAKPNAAGAASSVVGQLAALFNANAAQGKGSASAINVKNIGGGTPGSGTSLSGEGINVSGGLKAISDLISHTTASLGRFFTPGPSAADKADFADTVNAFSNPITSGNAPGKAADAALADESANYYFKGPSAYDYPDFNFSGSNEFGDNFDNFAQA